MKQSTLRIFLLILFIFSFNTVLFSETESLGGQKSSKLSSYATNPAPWLNISPNSEQRQPVYIGMTPREIALGLKPKDEGKLLIHDFLKVYGNKQARSIYDALLKDKKIEKGVEIEVEGYPVRNDEGILTWAFYSWRVNESHYNFFDQKTFNEGKFSKLSVKPILPTLYNPKNEDDHARIFNDILDFNSLYDKPLFGDCIWSDEQDGYKIISAWLPLEERKLFAKRVANQNKMVCRAFPQPARFNGTPVSFNIKINNKGVLWPKEIGWKKELKISKIQKSKNVITKWPDDFKSKYKEDLMVLDGELEASFPISGKKMRFTKKNNFEQNNHLLDIVAYLEERYKLLNIKTERMSFVFRGMENANLIAKIEGAQGTKKGELSKPVIMADHYDTAFCQDIFDKEKKRVSTSGADDNMTATATLLRAAEIFTHNKPANDVWLLHITGEEFPADDLGARIFTERMLKEKRDIKGIVLLDMIGWRKENDRIFQVNPGDLDESLRIAQIAIKASSYITKFKPVLRKRFDRKSYLYNTDGLIFQDAGFPVILFNEHINAIENLDRAGYHDTTDTSLNLDFNYATDIARVAIETTAILSDMSSF